MISSNIPMIKESIYFRILCPLTNIYSYWILLEISGHYYSEKTICHPLKPIYLSLANVLIYEYEQWNETNNNTKFTFL